MKRTIAIKRRRIAAALMRASIPALASLLAVSAYARTSSDGGTPTPILPLTGETLTGTPVTTSATCNPAGTSTFTYAVSGVAAGPYPGTFTETGTATIGSQISPGGGTEAALLLSFNASFVINSPLGNVTGTKQLPPGVGVGECIEFGFFNSHDIVIPITPQPAAYTATIRRGGGEGEQGGDDNHQGDEDNQDGACAAAQDHGSTTVALLNEVINGQVFQQTFTESFVSSTLSPVSCCANGNEGEGCED
jgi:hypothetical protein